MTPAPEAIGRKGELVTVAFAQARLQNVELRSSHVPHRRSRVIVYAK
jgi:hypothetical protein